MNRKIETIKDDPMVKCWGNDDAKISKTERYKWKKPEKKGKLMWIDIKELNIDVSYQREIDSKPRVAEIARGFDWALFGVLLVSFCDGSYYIIDGGHRFRGASRRDDIKEVPCLVFEFKNKSEEARIFYLFNKQRKTVSTFDNHKAALSGEGLFYESEISIKAENLVKKYGYKTVKTVKSQFETAAIGTIYRLIERDEIVAEKAFSILAKVAEGEHIQAHEMVGLFYLISQNRGVDFFTFPLKNLIDAGIGKIREEISRTKMYEGKAGEKVYGQALAKIINKGQIKEKVYIP